MSKIIFDVGANSGKVIPFFVDAMCEISTPEDVKAYRGNKQ
jgi:hypothetical protein